jgi:hypothetical protein
MMLQGLNTTAEDVLISYRNNLLGESLNEMPGGVPTQNQRPSMQQMFDPTQPVVEEAQENVQVDQIQEMFR